MGRIDTSDWHEFSLKSLFNIKLADGDLQPKKLEEGDFRLVSSGKTNNGICMLIEEQTTSTLIPDKTITVDMFGKCFYQNEPYYAVSHGRVNILWPLYGINEYQGLFLSMAIETVTSDLFSFTEMCSSNKLGALSIKLPAIQLSDGTYEPDWDYMEKYMKKIEDEANAELDALLSVQSGGELIDTSDWQEFRVGDLFVQDRGKEKAPNQNQEGNCRLINEINSNNGQTRFVKPTKVFEGNCLTVSVNYACNVFYQSEPFCASINIIILKSNKLSPENGKFISAILRSAHKEYSYVNKISKDRINNEIIKLPATQLSDGTYEPDWDYMDNYMKAVERWADATLDTFSSIPV